jgi:hypothetical protein
MKQVQYDPGVCDTVRELIECKGLANVLAAVQEYCNVQRIGMRRKSARQLASVVSCARAAELFAIEAEHYNGELEG